VTTVGVAADLGLEAFLSAGPARSGFGRSAFGRGLRLVASTRPGARVFARTAHHLDPIAARINRGGTLTETLAGLPTIFLTSTGARTGLPRTNPLVAVPTGADVAVIGSNFGRATHPGWVHNLLADPRATASRRGRRVEVLAREATGARAEQIWQQARALYHGYRTYPERTGGRVIRVFVLEACSAEPGPTRAGPRP
jgi:deazaflavin-dependent oxidoreductase (nitroreductase family)